VISQDETCCNAHSVRRRFESDRCGYSSRHPGHRRLVVATAELVPGAEPPKAHAGGVTTDGTLAEHSAKIAQACGMVSVQARCSLGHVMLLMRERAVIQSRTLEQIAEAVVDRSIHFG
jgi:hypothetical protein